MSKPLSPKITWQNIFSWTGRVSILVYFGLFYFFIMCVENVCRALKPALSFLDTIHRVRRTVQSVSPNMMFDRFLKESLQSFIMNVLILVAAL